jgi:predicted DNA binding protein
MDNRLQNAPIGIINVLTDGTVEDINEVAQSLIKSTHNSTGAHLTQIFPRSVEDTVLNAFEGDSVSENSFEEYYPNQEQWLEISIESTDESATIYLQDVTERKRYEQSIEHLQKERKRATVIENIFSEILENLVGATSRKEIAKTICRSLGKTEMYEFAWVGERKIGSDDLVVHAASGETAETFTAVREAVESKTEETLEERAVESGRLQSVQSLANSSQLSKSVRKTGFADGIQSALAIPLRYGSNIHGVVGVYAAGTEAFSDRERTSFETLGEVAGFAVTAARNRNLLLSDTITELTFEVDGNSVLSELSQSLNSILSLEGLVPHEDDALLCFISVEDSEIQAVKETVAEIDGISATRAIRDSSSDVTVEITVQNSSPLLAVSSLGGTVRQANFDSGSGQIVVELPPDNDVRRIADVVSRNYDLEFVAKEERERSVTTAREFRDALNDRLTDRQQTVLQTAYFADYFESPRGSTAEEVASSLDITGSTLLHHLRAGQRKLLDAYLGERTESFEEQ